MTLRSASDFPLHPPPEDLPDIYRECRAALVSANRSRGVLKAQSDRRGVVIAEVPPVPPSPITKEELP